MTQDLRRDTKVPTVLRNLSLNADEDRADSQGIIVYIERSDLIRKQAEQIEGLVQANLKYNAMVKELQGDVRYLMAHLKKFLEAEAVIQAGKKK